MARLIIGRSEFEPNCKKIQACYRGVSDAEVVVLGQRIADGDFGMLEILALVSCSAFIRRLLLGCCD